MDTGEQDAGGQVLAELRELRQRERRLGRAKQALIAEARRQRSSWTEIGEALGIDKESVYGLYKDELRRIEAGADADELSPEEALAQEREEAEILRRSPSADRS